MNGQSMKLSENIEDADEDYDDIFEDEDEIDAEDLMSSNPADFTKSYNRQRQKVEVFQPLWDRHVPD